MSQASNTSQTVVVFIAVIVFIVAVRVFRTLRGARVSAGRTLGFIAFYVAFGLYFVGNSLALGAPPLYAVIDFALAALAANWSYRYSDKRISFWKNSEGVIYFRGGIIIYLIWVGALVARVAVSYVFIGPSAFGFAPVTSLTQTALLGYSITDLLLSLGIGLVVGRNLRIYRRYKLIAQGKEQIPGGDAPSNGK